MHGLSISQSISRKKLYIENIVCVFMWCNWRQYKRWEQRNLAWTTTSILMRKKVRCFYKAYIILNEMLEYFKQKILWALFFCSLRISCCSNWKQMLKIKKIMIHTMWKRSLIKIEKVFDKIFDSKPFFMCICVCVCELEVY